MVKGNAGPFNAKEGPYGIELHPVKPPNPLEAHLALAVESLDDVRCELESRKVPFLFLPGKNATGVDQVFIRDPAGHVIELHEFGKCRCDREEIAE